MARMAHVVVVAASSIPYVPYIDGPTYPGHRLSQCLPTIQPPRYQLPSSTAIMATFDINLMNRIGNLLGDEGRRKVVHVALAPVVCIPTFTIGWPRFRGFCRRLCSQRHSGAKLYQSPPRTLGCCLHQALCSTRSVRYGNRR